MTLAVGAFAFGRCLFQYVCKDLQQVRNIQRLCNMAVHTGLQRVLTVFLKGICVIAKMGMPAFAASGRARICRVAS